MSEYFRLLGYSSGTVHCDRLAPLEPRRGWIVGGGGFFEERVQSALRKQLDERQRVALVGVDAFGQKRFEFPNFIKFVSARSTRSVEKLQSLGSATAVYAPDVAWALVRTRGGRPTYPVRKPVSSSKRRLLGLNTTPFPKTIVAAVLRHAPRWEKAAHRGLRTGDAQEGVWRLFRGMCEVMQAVAASYVRKGWEVEVIPFDVDDEAFSRILFARTSIVVRKFSRDPYAILRRLGHCDRLIATRYHAHVLGFLSRVPLLSVAYDAKVEWLWQDNALSAYAQVLRQEIVETPGVAVSKLVDGTGVRLPEEGLLERAQAAEDSIRAAVAALGVTEEGVVLQSRFEA